MEKLAMNAQYNEIFFTWEKTRILTPFALAKGLQQIGDLLPFASSLFIFMHALVHAQKSIDLICCFQIKNKCCLQPLKWHGVQVRSSFANLIGETREPLRVQIWCAPLSAR
jgi:hypothetical protein